MIFNLISFFLGFLTSSILDTSLGTINPWKVTNACFVVAFIETFNHFYHSLLKRIKLINKPNFFFMLDILNFFKVGTIYGLIVDAFKLGS